MISFNRRKQTGNIGLWLKLSTLLLMTSALSGCNYFVLLGYLIGGPPSIEPDFDAMTKKSMTAKDVTVVAFCFAPQDLKLDFSKVDQELTRYLSHRLHQHQIKVINPERVHEWLQKNDEWDRPEEIGEAFDATYVIYVDLIKYSLWEEHSVTLYRGRAEAIVSVIEIDESGNGERIFSKEITSRYPLSMPRDSSEVNYNTFKRQYLSRLSEEIGRLFYEYYNGDDISDAT